MASREAIADYNRFYNRLDRESLQAMIDWLEHHKLIHERGEHLEVARRVRVQKFAKPGANVYDKNREVFASIRAVGKEEVIEVVVDVDGEIETFSFDEVLTVWPDGSIVVRYERTEFGPSAVRPDDM